MAGLYEQQDDEQVEHNLSGRFITNEEGKYAFYCLRPTPYPVSNPITCHEPFLTTNRSLVMALLESF
jgi:protocatechuate 3,4-dioxygenase beta subunit